MSELDAKLEELFRRESGRILAGLIRTARSFDLAEEALQDAFAAALQSWEKTGLPENPAAWLTTAAQRKLIDTVRKQQTHRQHEDQLRYESPGQAAPPDLEQTMPQACSDDRLSLIFTCCHPALSRESQIALTLRTLCGLTTTEIARAFLIAESSLAQRIVRAKRKIQEARIPYQIPPPAALPERLFAVQFVLYLIFNEGYSATSGDALVRRDLCNEAIRLARVLCELMPNAPENLGLLALMILHDSRRDTRMDAAGDLVPLEDQDRSKWDRGHIDEGLAVLDRAVQMRCPGPYQLQAAIAGLHAQAQTAQQTDWAQIAALYAELARHQPSATVTLNYAVAVAMSEGLERGLQLVDEANARGELDSYHLFHAAKADLLRRQGRNGEALLCYQRALALTKNAVEQRYLQHRLNTLS